MKDIKKLNGSAKEEVVVGTAAKKDGGTHKVVEKVEAKVPEVDVPEKEDGKDHDGPVKPKIRQIIVETDGNSVKLAVAEVLGNIELKGILEAVLELIKPIKM